MKASQEVWRTQQSVYWPTITTRPTSWTRQVASRSVWVNAE
jgi:hypothetical protein